MPGIAVHVFNKGIGGQDADEMAARMRADVKPERAQLVVWQVGTNSAIRRVPTDQFAARLRAGIDIGKSLGIKVVAEGVETMEQVEQLRVPGSELGQGFYYSKPLASMQELLAETRE